MSLKFAQTSTVWLKAAILLLACLYVCAQVEFRKYKRVSALDGFQCLVTDLVLEDDAEDDTGLIITSCAAQCTSNANCSSFFYFPATQLCLGCQAVYSALDAHPILAGSNYYVRESGYGQSCAVSEECMEDNNGCYDNVCKCKPGYPRDNITRQCAKECTTYGDTFERYRYRNLRTILPAYKTHLFQSGKPDNCLQKCREDPVCISMDHSPVSLICQFYRTTAASGGTVLLFDLFFSHFSRNCG